MKNNHTLGVIVPIFNEQLYLLESVMRLLKVDIISEIILVDDNSTDSSYEIAQGIESRNSKVKLVKTKSNLGKGNAVNTGVVLLNTDYLIVHDADLEYFPDDIEEMYQKSLLFPESLILGSRVIGDKERKKLYYLTYLGNKVFALIFSFLNNYQISDIASCYWLIELKSFKKLQIQEKGFAIEVEVLSKFLKSGQDIKEVPIKYEARSYENGKKIKIKDAVSIFFKIIKYSK
ncbi:glycosyltransferase family 2 protein [Acidimicrobiia bacterium]|nr:glycosyltransferase family 2 protein [Acidimicrobiia bacterium]